MARIDAKLKTAALALLLVSVTIVMAASVTPYLISPWTHDWEVEYIKDYCWVKFEYDEKGGTWKWETSTGNGIGQTWTGTCCGCTCTITITVIYEGGEPKSFDWESTCPISAVIVKTGKVGSAIVANLYKYDPPVTSDTELVAPDRKGISHIIFCWKCPSERVPEFPLVPEAIAALGLVAWTAVRRRRKL